MASVRTRFAPSPTGSLHLGGARTALFNYLFAKKHGGVFVLRIEDTDVVRSTEASEDVILSDLTWLGLRWDEGPNTIDKVGPYRQSERREIYETQRALISQDLLYPCYCTEEELTKRRKASLEAGKTPMYDGRCRHLSDTERKRLESEGKIPAWRFNVSAFGEKHGVHTVTVSDLIRGEVKFDLPLIGDFILIKSNGFPSYNFACVVDDYLMQISHVIRGDEHLTNTPRQLLIYQTLGWESPTFAHLSMILAPDHTKLSKRHGTTAVGEFKEKGYLPHAIVNYISLLGWSPKTDQELFLPEKQYDNTEQALQALLNELSHAFNLEGVSKNAAVFDIQKLAWMNAHILRILSLENLFPIVARFLKERSVEISSEALRAILSTQRQNVETLSDFAELIREFFLPGQIQMEESGREVLSWPWAGEIVHAFEREIKALPEISDQDVPPLMKRIQSESGKKGKELYWPIRVGVTGKTHGPELIHLFPILGKGEILSRLDKTKSWFKKP